MIAIKIAGKVEGFDAGSASVVSRNTEDILRRADTIITPSESTKKDIMDTFPNADPDKIQVLYCGIASTFENKVDVRKYNLPEKYILYFGTCIPHKNVTTLVKAYSLLAQELRSEYKLAIPNPDNTVKNCVNQLGLSERVHYIYKVPEEDKPGIYQNASLFVFPSFYEGFGIPIIEAQASGVPVVCSNTSSMPEAAGDAAILVDPRDTQGMADVISRVLTNDDLRRDLIAKGYENIKRFSWDESARKLHDIIVSL